MKSLFKVLTTFSILIILASNVSAVTAYSIEGNIKDKLAVRLPGATISSNDFYDEVTSDSTGHFTMSRLYLIGTYSFTVSKKGYSTENIDVRVVGYDITNANAILTFIGASPDAITMAPIDVTTTRATLMGDVNPNGYATKVDFASNGVYGTSSYFPVTPTQNIGSGSSSLIVTHTVTGLTPNTEYSYVVRTSNEIDTTKGALVTFKTLSEIENGILKIKSNVNAKAYVDSKFVGNTNPETYLTYLTTAETHTISVQQIGYIPYTKSIMVKSDKNSNPYTYVDVNLIPSDPTLPVVTIPPIKPPSFPCIFGCPDDGSDDSSGWGFDFPDWGCIFGCDEEGASNPFGGFNFPNFGDMFDFNFPAFPDFGNLFGPPSSEDTGTTGNKVFPQSGGNDSTTPLKPTYNFWWLLIILIIVGYTYYNRKKFFGKKRR